jgi:CRISPR/Cas system CMR subunit Cmr6 (Cas7 group RAMP superfamily)
MSDDKQINGYINPYNFVRLPNEKGKADKTEGQLSGSFDIEIKTKTPLFIANSSQPADNAPMIFYTNSTIDANSTDKCYEPVIPGSSIRGVVRSMHEALFKSCLSQIDDSNLTFRNTTNGSLKNPIMIIRDKKDHYKAFDAIKVFPPSTVPPVTIQSIGR